jgi:opacity protein-like surface antigen
MLNKILKIVRVTPVLMAGVFICAPTVHGEEKQVKPNIHQLTSDKTAKKVNNDIPESGDSESRIPGSIHKHSLGIGIGQTFLRSDFSSNGNDKITPDLYYTYSASYSFDFVANAHYSTHTYQDRKVKIEGLALSIKGKGYQFDAFSPFVLGGFGFYLPSATRANNGVLQDTRTQLVFGMNLGVGVELRLNDEVSVGVIAHYHDPFSVRQDVGPSLDGSYMKLLILASYTFH